MQVYHDSDRMRNYGRMLDFDRKIWFRSYIPTPAALPDSSRTPRLRSMSRLRSYLLTPVAHHGSSRWACHLSYHLSYERLRMVGLDDCSILQPGYLVGNRLEGTHDSISVQNLISHSFACGTNQVICRTTKDHLACRDLRKIWVSGGAWYPSTLEYQGFRISGQAST
jgi:hypothetical protein